MGMCFVPTPYFHNPELHYLQLVRGRSVGACLALTKLLCNLHCSPLNIRWASAGWKQCAGLTQSHTANVSCFPLPPDLTPVRWLTGGCTTRCWAAYRLSSGSTTGRRCTCSPASRSMRVSDVTCNAGMGEGVECSFDECRERGQPDAGKRERPLGEIFLCTPDVNAKCRQTSGCIELLGAMGWRTVLVFLAVGEGSTAANEYKK